MTEWVFSRNRLSGLAVLARFRVDDDTFDMALDRDEPRVDGLRDLEELGREMLLLRLGARNVGGGVVGGVGGKMLIGEAETVVMEDERVTLVMDPVLMDSGLDGGRYVIPIPLCTPVMSLFGAKSATVTSPALPLEESGGMLTRKIVSSLRSSKRFNASTFSG